MATYLDTLSKEPQRLRGGLVQLAEDQEANVTRLEHIFGDYISKLDQNVLRYLMLRQRFGAGHGETLEAERVMEDSSKPVTELRGVLQRQREILEVFKGHLQEYDQTGALASLSSSGAEVPAETV